MPPVDPAALPKNPGCYLFRDAEGSILYIGKAKNLRQRVAHYLKKEDHDPKTRQLVGQIADVDVIVTENEVEALILESNLIKRHQPKYNIDLKDAKSFAYIQISDDPFPRIGIARRPSGEGGSLYGPFVSARERDHVLRVLKKTFTLRSCRRLPKRACLRYHMHSCSAPCIGKISLEAYENEVQKTEAVLKGRSSELLAALRTEMAGRSAAMEFEQAKEIRDQIAAIEGLTVRQHMERLKRSDEDIINCIVAGGRVTLAVFHTFHGRLAEKEVFSFDDRAGVLEEFLVQYYAEREPPRELILPRPVDDSLIQFLSVRKGRQVLVTIPQRGEKKKLLDLVHRNLELTSAGEGARGEELRRTLNLAAVPHVIECFDISHISGTSMVGSMVQFRNGKPDKRKYRRFRIRSVRGSDDLSSMAEVVRRRYTRLVREGEELPGLVIVDGGRGQVQAAKEELNTLHLSIPVIGIAKREERVYLPGSASPLPLSRDDRASRYIQEIRDEAHRFAHAYHTLLRRKEVKG